MRNKTIRREVRRQRTKKNMWGTEKRPRVCIFKSNKHCYIQAIIDGTGHVVLGMRDTDHEATKEHSKWFILGADFAKKLKKDKKVSSIFFDRSGYKYAGRIQDIADGMRSEGLKF
jgi:large subunit ribosomal protein L18